MLKYYNTSHQAVDLINSLYRNPISYVEELSILEEDYTTKSFFGYYNLLNFKEFVLIGETGESKSVYFYPISVNWKEINLRKIFEEKSYLQTNSLGEKIVTSLDIPIIVPHKVMYFSFNHQKRVNNLKKPNFKARINEKIISGKLINLELYFKNKNKKIASSGSNFINKKTAMIGIWVDPDWRQQGLAKYLLMLTIDKLVSHNIKPVYACDKQNVPSFQLAKFFFEPILEYNCMFLNNWTINRPLDADYSLPDSIFVS